jgi:SAM-dependent methyltransferase
MIKTFIYKGKEYPEYEKTGFASRFAFPFAAEVCHGVGYDIGYGKPDWGFPGSILIENGQLNAMNLPDGQVDYIFSSHCLEHIPDWVTVLDYWIDHIKVGGVLFLYLPHPAQEYWLPWNNRKHLYVFTQSVIRNFMEDRGFIKIFHSERDLYDSFMIFGEKE